MLYALTAVVVIAAEALIVFNWHPKAPLAEYVASVIIEPFFVAIVTAFTYADVRGDLSVGATWSRVLERSWAVLIIGLLVQLITAIGFQSISATDVFDKLLGAGVIIVAVSLIFADVYATVVDDAEPWWLLVPRSLGASMAITWRGVAFARALIVFMMAALLPELLTIMVQNVLAARHVPASLFWANAVSVLLLLPLVQAFCTLVYLDAIGYEPNRS
ncbi:MAG: hypothetical protein WBD74_14670 [Candidatus Aquilonibacter sp.]